MLTCLVRQTNKYLTDAAPWKAHSDLEIELTLRRPRVIRTILEALYVMAHLFLPFIPSGA
jgi:methionyl-tRNA synthetase